MWSSNLPLDLKFIAVGPQRTGTTWLYKMLQKHPALYLPKAVKETMFFDRHYDRGMDWYARYFEYSRNDQLCGEVAPTYFDELEVPERIYQVAPDCEIIINLRHPAERAFSLYLHHLRKGRVPKSFQKALRQKPRILTAGRYALHIPRWQSVFGEERIHFVFLDDIRTQPQRVLNQICSWLGVAPMEQPSETDEKVNAASMPRFPLLAKGAAYLTNKLHAYGLHWLVEFGKKLNLKKLAYTGGEENMPHFSTADREWLIHDYETDIAFVEEVTGRDLSSWRE